MPGPELGFCSGVYQGYYFGDSAPVVFQLDPSGQWGELHVTSWWRGGMWYGQGICRQISPYQASVEIYFPGAPVHRAMVSGNGYAWQMEGQIDFGAAFQLQRVR